MRKPRGNKVEGGQEDKVNEGSVKKDENIKGT